MMKNAGVSGGKYTMNIVVALVAMLYSTYAIYSSGGSAVMGGVLMEIAREWEDWTRLVQQRPGVASNRPAAWGNEWRVQAGERTQRHVITHRIGSGQLR